MEEIKMEEQMLKKLLNKKTAVIVIDMQNDYVQKGGKIDSWGLGITKLQKMLPKAKKFLDEARESGASVIHFKMQSGKNDLNQSLVNVVSEMERKRFADRKGITPNEVTLGAEELWTMAEKGTWGNELVMTAHKKDTVFEKRSYDCFSSLEFQKYLRDNGIETLIVIGGYTNVCVDTTTRSAATRGYNVILAEDLIGTPDVSWRLHEASLISLGNIFAHIEDSETILKNLNIL